MRSSSAERNIYIDLSKIEQVTIQNGNRVHFGCPSGQRCVRVLERNPTRQRMVYGSYEVVPNEFRRNVIRAQAERIRAQCDPGGKA